MFPLYESNLTVLISVGELGLLRTSACYNSIIIIIFFCSKKPLYCCFGYTIECQKA